MMTSPLNLLKLYAALEKKNQSQDKVAADGEAAILLCNVWVEYMQVFGPGIF